MKFALLMIAMIVAVATAAPSPRVAQSAPIVEFTILQYLSVQTLTCTKYELLADLSQYGHLTATGCSSTGALLDEDSTLGHVNLDITLTGGVRYLITGCQLDSTYVSPGYSHYTIECT